MSLLTTEIVIERTKEDIKKHAKINLARETKDVYESLVRKYNDIMNRFWENHELTPQEVSDALGTDAYSLFLYGNAMSTLIMTVNPSETRLKVPKNAFTINQDGTVTISDQPYVG